MQAPKATCRAVPPHPRSHMLFPAHYEVLVQVLAPSEEHLGRGGGEGGEEKCKEDAANNWGTEPPSPLSLVPCHLSLFLVWSGLGWTMSRSDAAGSGLGAKPSKQASKQAFCDWGRVHREGRMCVVCNLWNVETVLRIPQSVQTHASPAAAPVMNR
jgi:hypothetical protein